MDWQGTEVSSAHRAAVLSKVFNITLPGGQEVIDSLREWPKRMAVIEAQLKKTCAYITGPQFTLADICIGLTVNRWFATPTGEKPDFPQYPHIMTGWPSVQPIGATGATVAPKFMDKSQAKRTLSVLPCGETSLI